jgi:hypothetical protein
MLGSLVSSIPGLVGLAFFFVLVFEFLRGMRALGQIATRLERIEHILNRAALSVPNQSSSHTAT